MKLPFGCNNNLQTAQLYQLHESLMRKCSHKCKLSPYTYKLQQLRLLDSWVQILPPVSLDTNCNKFNLSQQLLLCTTESI